MIELNMLKQRPVTRGIPSEKDGAKLLGVFLTAVLIGSLLAVGLLHFISRMKSPKVNADGFTNVEVNVKNTNAIQIGDLKDSVTGEIIPNKHFTAYNDMSMLERINYEHVYAYYLFREFSIIPADVDFNTVGFNGYQNVKATGGVRSEKGVRSLFASLKLSGWTLKPKPASRFRLVDGVYQFVFEGKYRIEPSDVDAAALTESDIPSIEHLDRIKDSISTVVLRMPVVSTGKLDLDNTEFEGKYRHYTYTMSGKSSFIQFRELLSGLRLLKLPISLSDVELNAYEGGLKWRTTVKITVK